MISRFDAIARVRGGKFVSADRPTDALTPLASSPYTAGLFASQPMERITRAMKSDRRHELEQNELAQWLADWGERIKPYQNYILGGVVLIAAAFVAYSIWARSERQRNVAAWEQYYSALDTRSPGEMEDLIEAYPGTPTANWAAAVAADLRLANACNLLFSDKASANQNLREAVDLYLTVLDESDDPELRERATFGLARAYEAQTNLDKAAEHYETVIDRWPQGAYAVVARDRLLALEKKSVRELYDKFANWEPRAEFDDQRQLSDSAPVFDLDALPEGRQFTPRTTFGLDDVDQPDSGDEPDSVDESAEGADGENGESQAGEEGPQEE